MMNLADVVDDLAQDSFLVRRFAADEYVDGILVSDPAPQEFWIRAVVAPLSGKDLERLPEASRVRAGVTVFCSVALRGATDQSAPDTIEVDGEQYEVTHLEKWGNLGNYHKATALKLGH